MPLYFFHLKVGDTLDEDEFGVELADPASAWGEALIAVAGFMRDAALTGKALPGEAFEVVDEQGRRLFTIPFDVLINRPPQVRRRDVGRDEP